MIGPVPVLGPARKRTLRNVYDVVARPLVKSNLFSPPAHQCAVTDLYK